MGREFGHAEMRGFSPLGRMAVLLAAGDEISACRKFRVRMVGDRPGDVVRPAERDGCAVAVGLAPSVGDDLPATALAAETILNAIAIGRRDDEEARIRGAGGGRLGAESGKGKENRGPGRKSAHALNFSADDEGDQ